MGGKPQHFRLFTTASCRSNGAGRESALSTGLGRFHGRFCLAENKVQCLVFLKKQRDWNDTTAPGCASRPSEARPLAYFLAFWLFLGHNLKRRKLGRELVSLLGPIDVVGLRVLTLQPMVLGSKLVDGFTEGRLKDGKKILHSCLKPKNRKRRDIQHKVQTLRGKARPPEVSRTEGGVAKWRNEGLLPSTRAPRRSEGPRGVLP